MQEKNTQKKPTTKKQATSKIKKHAVPILIALNIVLLIINIATLAFLPIQTNGSIKARSEILANQLQNQSAQKLITDLKAIKPQTDKISKTLPNKSQLLDIIKEIETLNGQATVQHFSFESEQPKQDKDKNLFLPITLVLEGTVPQIAQTLKALQNKPHLYTITQSRLESPGGLSQPVTIFTNLRLYVREEFN